jgi:hypothetical protein
MRGRQQRLSVVVAETSPIARMLRLTGLDQSLPVHDTLPQALGDARAF